MFSLNIANSIFIYLFVCLFQQGLGTDEACLIEILSSHTNAEIWEISQVYSIKQVQSYPSNSPETKIYF